MPSLEAFLLVAAALMGVGLYGALSQQSIVMVMMGLELILNGILLALVAIWHQVAPQAAQGQMLALVALTLMAVEAAMGFAIVIALYRGRRIDTLEPAQELRG